jgi:ABC-type branched-subunit amino acid transport system ATPase component/ABC-type branched-subunit amino acid transport system permease subunit
MKRILAVHSVTQPRLPGSLVRIWGVNVGVDEIIIVAVGLVTVLFLHLVLEYSTLGRSMRAVVDNPDLLSMTGRSPHTALRAGWAIGIGFVGLSGLLLVLSPSYSVGVTAIGALVLQSFGGAAIGGFTSLPLTYAGGMIIGLLSALSTKYVTDVPWLIGLPPSIPFLVLFFVLVLRPRHLAAESTSRSNVSSRHLIRVSRLYRVPVAAALVAGILCIPLSGSVHLIYTGNLALGYAIVFLGLGLLVRTSGQVSLCQMGLAAVGATTFAKLAQTLGLPWFAALLLAGAAAAIVGAIVAVPAIRVAGIYLALATYGFGVLLELLAYPTKLMFETGGAVANVPRPVIGPLDAGNDTTFFFVCLALFSLALLSVSAVRRARLGRLLGALADSPVALTTEGCSINTVKVAVFVISAFLAGVGGALIVSQNRFLTTDPFSSTNSLLVVAVVLTIRVVEPAASLLAAAAFVIVPSFLSGRAQIWWLDIGFGVAAVVVAVARTSIRLPRFAWAPVAPAHQPLPPSGPRPDTPDRYRSTPESGLEITDLSVHFGGLVALDEVRLDALPGQITGLVGPNGAGKTTLFNFCSGFVPAVTGSLYLNGRNLSSLSPSARARSGLGRTFQTPTLFDSLTVSQNVALGREAGLAGRRLLNHAVASRVEKRLTTDASSEAMDLVGISPIAGRQVESLSTSERRLVELARCLAGSYQMLLLDEPSSGLDVEETRNFGGVLQRVIRERGTGILLIEHDMALVVAVCSSLYALDFGRIIFHGQPSEALTSDVLRDAYLGAGAAG